MLKKAMMAAALTTSAALASSTAVPASAQVQAPSGLVNVTVGDVILQDILTDIEITALNDVITDNQLIVQVPIGVAANVCNVSAAVLAQSGAGGECTASSGSQALAQAIRKQYLRR